MPLGQGQEQSTIQQGDPRLGWWLLPRGHLMYFHFGKRRVGQDGGMFTQVWYPRVCSSSGAFWEGKPAVKVARSAPEGDGKWAYFASVYVTWFVLQLLFMP